MPALRLPARLTRPRAGGDPPAAHRSRLGRTVRVLFLAVLLPPALWFFGPYAGGDRIAQITHPYEFHLVLWEAGQLGGRLPGLLQQLAAPPPADSALASPEAKAAVQEFFAAAERWQRAVRAGASPEEQEALRAAWQARRAPAEQAIAQTLAALAVREGLTASWLGKEILLPPVSFLLSEPPQVLVVSPRDRIEVVRSVLLRPDLSLAEVEALEREVDRLGVVSLVVPIGGFASYPAMVPLHATPRDTLNAIAHEWVHNLLVFYPLGRAYFASYDSRTLNETVAELAGRELGAMLAAAYGLPRRSSAAHEAAPAAGTFDFRQEMRATRLHLEQLLAAGQLEEAERYLEERRQAFVAAGYPLRKLNQAYFAFYGSYADSPAAVSPLDEQLRLLRAHSPSLGAFLRRVAQMTSSAEVEAALRALGAWPPAPEPNADLPSQQEVAAGGELVP